MVSVEAQAALSSLGERIRVTRLRRNESQTRFSARLAISVPTLRKLEKGDPTVSLGVLAEALCVMERLDDLRALFSLPTADPFARWEIETSEKPARRRASAPRKKR